MMKGLPEAEPFFISRIHVLDTDYPFGVDFYFQMMYHKMLRYLNLDS